MSSVIFLSCSLYKLQNPSVQGSIIIPAFFLSRKKLRPEMLNGLTKVTKLSQTQGLAGQGHFSFPLSYQA